MKEEIGNIWDKHKEGKWIVITTNGMVRKDGACVMGRGVAAQAKKRYPSLAYELGKRIQDLGNRVHVFRHYGIITFPVKHEWFEKADLKLIEESTRQLCGLGIGHVFLVRPGAGNGGLDWSQVKPILEKYLDDTFTVVELAR